MLFCEEVLNEILRTKENVQKSIQFIEKSNDLIVDYIDAFKQILQETERDNLSLIKQPNAVGEINVKIF